MRISTKALFFALAVPHEASPPGPLERMLRAPIGFVYMLSCSLLLMLRGIKARSRRARLVGLALAATVVGGLLTAQTRHSVQSLANVLIGVALLMIFGSFTNSGNVPPPVENRRSGGN